MHAQSKTAQTTATLLLACVLLINGLDPAQTLGDTAARPIAHYKCNDTSGTSATDAYGNTAAGAYTSTTGKINTAFLFNGSTTKLTSQQNAGLTADYPVTINAWVNWIDNSNYQQVIICKDVTSMNADAIMLALNQDGTLFSAIGGTYGTEPPVTRVSLPHTMTPPVLPQKYWGERQA